MTAVSEMAGHAADVWPAHGSEERPLVTLAVFAYNQEQYIREAVEGAFAQTYSPLEIILSDDCSSDRTFNIMKEMAEVYDGPHRVIVRRNKINVGTALHVQLVFDTSAGQLFVVAAGDDISKPERVAVLSAAWSASGRRECVLHSGRELFGADGSIKIVAACQNEPTGEVLRAYTKCYWLPAAAPTCAYTRGVFESFSPLVGGSLIEDAPLQLRGALIGEFIACKEVLVLQRLHDNNTGTGYNIGTPNQWNRFIHSKTIAFRTMQTDLMHYKGIIDPKIRAKIEKNILHVVRSTSALIMPESDKIGLLARVRMLLCMLTGNAISSNMRNRVIFAFSFFAPNTHTKLRRIYSKRSLVP